MKFFAIVMTLIVALSVQAGGPKRDGFLKNNSEVVLVLESSGLVGNCYSLVAKEGKLDLMLSPPAMTVNGQSVQTSLSRSDFKTSNKSYEITGVDVSGVAFKIKAKKGLSIMFCANDAQVEPVSPYNKIELKFGEKVGSVEVPTLR